MQIDFCEEFPTQKNLDKLRLIKFNSSLVIAAHSIPEFNQYEKKVKRINKMIKCIYWPIIPNSYWISPFSYTDDLKELFASLNNYKREILVDIEFPIKFPNLFFKNFFSFFRNKKLIRSFLEKNKERVITVHFPVIHISPLRLYSKFVGLYYEIKLMKSIMFYTSMIPKMFIPFIKRGLAKIKNKDEFVILLGTTDIGILGDEPILSSNELDNDLEYCQRAGFKRVAIFRLGGLNKEYMKVINKYAK